MPKIADLITRHDGRIERDATLADAASLMLGEGISSVIVVDRGQVAGIVTEGDVLHAMREHRALHQPVVAAMTSPVHTVAGDTAFRDAYRDAARHGLRHIVVTDDAGLPVGVASETEFRHHLGPDFFRHLNTVDTLMERLFPRLPPEAGLDMALAAMEAARATCVVVMERRRPVGIVTERDVVRLFLDAEDNPRLASVMTAPVLTIAHDASLSEAAERMNGARVRHLVVVDPEGHAVGLLSEHTLMRPLELDLVDDALAERLSLSRSRDDAVAMSTRYLADKKRAEEAVIMRNAALAGLIRGEPLSGVLELITLSIETEMPGWRCSVLVADEAGEHLRFGAAPHLPDAYNAAINGMRIAPHAGSCGAAAALRRRVIAEDVFTHPNWAPYHDLARLGGFAACWSEPILGPRGELLGTFAVYHDRPASPGQYDTGQLVQAGQLTGLILAHERAARKLESSLDTFHGIFNSISEALYIQAEDGRFLDVNQGAEQLLGYSRDALIGRTHASIGAPGLNDLEAVNGHLAAAFAGQPQCFEYWVRNSAGDIMPHEVRLRRGEYFGEPVLIASALDISDRHRASLRLNIENDLAQSLAAGTPRDQVLATLLGAALRFPEIDCGEIHWQTPDGGYRMLSHRGLSTEFVAATGEHAADSRIAAIARAGHMVCSCDSGCGREKCVGQSLLDLPAVRQEALKSLVILPILIDRRAVACLLLASHQSAQWSAPTLLALEDLAPLFGQTLIRQGLQEEARNRQENLDGLFDSINDFIFIVDMNGRIVHYNRAVAVDLGYGPDSLIGQPAATVHPENERQTASRLLADMLSGQRKLCTLPLRHASGDAMMAETRAVSGHWNGEPALFCIARDISARLLAEERQKLAASVFDNAHEGIMVTDAQGRIVEVNATFSELTGYSREEAVGRNADLLKSGHHDPAFYEAMWRTIREAGYWRGEVWNRKKSGEIFAELLTISTVRGRQGEISHFVGIFSDITLLKQHQQRLEHLAHFDALTQLPNRMLLADRMQLAMAQAERSGKTLAVCYLDLDGFKPVNDQYGHGVGDRLLVEVAQRLKACTRAGDTVSRLGGDEFVLLYSGLDDDREVDRAIGRVFAALNQPFQIAANRISISASLGVTLFPHDAADADALLRHADQAMYAAKQAGRNRYHLFDPERDRLASARREEMARLRKALEDGEFVLHYQPKVNMRKGTVIGAEALIRWQHPELGLLPPERFLPAIEGSELAIDIGDWVIREALRQLEKWRAEGIDLAVSINIAGNHLQHASFASRLGELLAACPSVPANRLELEVLETTALDDMANMAGLFAECRRLGVSFALDDFGTGYSSLTYFRRLPADILKIDQSFVRDMLEDADDLAIVEGVIGLTQAFNRQVIAEGVETVEHGLVLLLLGCDLAQGYGIARPMPAAALPDWMRDFRPDELWGSAAAFNWSREDLPMLIAEVDHRRWKKALYHYLGDRSGRVPAPTEDHRHCRFGRWYYGEASRRYAGVDGFAALEGVHGRLHDIGNRLVTERDQLDDDAADALKAELEATSGLLSEHIQQIMAERLLLGRTARH